ncbi:hypothetical protein DHD05_18420 [Arenibacter sp. N53]|uniref:hypothetical protein n=1 Tax=Arenibacter TaxID=178469 RepID=UPI000CD3B8F8|nr:MULTISPECIES: hypothetical protein [Arenibacter]MCM4153572.1 hypothetical protein [Arenibacter sp. N53]
MISCENDSPDEIIRKVERDYEKEYGSDLIMHRDWERYNGMDVYRFAGWTVEDDRNYTEINSDEWIILFCTDKKYKILKHTGYLPIDTIIKINNIKCLPEK